MEEEPQGTALEISNYLKEKVAERRSLKDELTDLFVSLFLFMALGGAFYSSSGILGLVLVLFLHELGHFLGMKAFGYREVRMRFVPFLGAFTAGRESNPNTAQRAIMTLLGPCPGILIGFILWIVYEAAGVASLSQLSTLFLLINGFNLLPLTPLDGGRVVDDLLFARDWELQSWFRVLMFFALLFLAFWCRSVFIGVIAIFALLQIGLAGAVGRVAEEVKDWDPPDAATAALEQPPARYLRLIVDKLEHESWFCRLQAKENSLAAQARFVESIWQKVRNRYPSGKTTAALLGIFLLFLLGALPNLRMWLVGIDK